VCSSFIKLTLMKDVGFIQPYRCLRSFTDFVQPIEGLVCLYWGIYTTQWMIINIVCIFHKFKLQLGITDFFIVEQWLGLFCMKQNLSCLNLLLNNYVANLLLYLYVFVACNCICCTCMLSFVSYCSNIVCSCRALLKNSSLN